MVRQTPEHWLYQAHQTVLASHLLYDFHPPIGGCVAKFFGLSYHLVQLAGNVAGDQNSRYVSTLSIHLIRIANVHFQKGLSICIWSALTSYPCCLHYIMVTANYTFFTSQKLLCERIAPMPAAF